MSKTVAALLMLFIFPQTFSQPKTDSFLAGLLQQKKDSLLQHVLNNPDSFRFQIIYTQIDRDHKNKPSFKNFYYNVDAYRYFNPASTVKMPLAFLALEKLHTIPDQLLINKFSTVLFDSSWSGQVKEWKDSTSETGNPSIAQYIRKVFLVSDNEAYNRLYEFISQQTINRRLHDMGYKNTRITRRFVRMTPEENRHTNQVTFLNAKGKPYVQYPAYNTDSFDFSRVNKMGRAYLDRDGKLINEPIDFTMANNLPLEDLQQQLQSVLFPESVPEKQRFKLKPEDYRFLYQYMSQYPSETNYPNYDSSVYYDSYVKFYFKNGGRRMLPHIRVFNKVGWAYGCATDVSYIVDFQNRVEYMITATIYANKDGVMNDDIYEYETVAAPWFHAIGEAIYAHELQRPRKYVPDLSRFKINYEKRKADGRKTIREVDN